MTHKICPLSIAVSGNYRETEYDGIHVEPRLNEEVILISINTLHEGVKEVASIAFPKHGQTLERFHKSVKDSLGKTLSVLI